MMETPASLNRSKEEGCGQADEQSISLNIQSGGGTSLLRLASSDGGSCTRTTGVGNLTLALVITLNPVLIGERLEEVVASTLDIASGLDVEGTLDVVELGDIDPGLC